MTDNIGREAEINRLRSEIARVEDLRTRLNELLVAVASEELSVKGISVGSIVTAKYGYATGQTRRYRVLRIAGQVSGEPRPRILGRATSKQIAQKASLGGFTATQPNKRRGYILVRISCP